MFHYKGFDSASVGDDLARLEAAVNEWMRQQQPRIRLMAQSPRGEHVVVSFVYELGGDAERHLAAQVAVPEVFERTMEDADLDLEDEPDEVEAPGLPEAELPY
jgi:hypothetical protein